jgi:hypothetical protein
MSRLTGGSGTDLPVKLLRSGRDHHQLGRNCSVRIDSGESP